MANLFIASSQQQHKSMIVGCITYPTLSTFSVGGNRNTGKETHDFRKSVELLLISHDGWVRRPNGESDMRP